MNDSGFIRLRRLTTDEIVGTEDKAGLIERYFSLMPEGDRTLQDIDLSAREMRIGDNRLCLHTLSDAEDLPGKVSTDVRYEKLSTDRSDCRLSFASPVGLLLPCNHIYNQYVILDISVPRETGEPKGVARRTCRSSRSPPATCSRSPDTVGATASTVSG